jgi:proline dehydrogenase
MFRSFFVTMSRAAWAQRLITRWGFAWRTASRFVAGETSVEAIQAVQALNQPGIQASLDHLGENTMSPQAAVQATAEILLALDKIQEAGVRSNVSIKLTQIGLALDHDLCQQNLLTILERARQYQNFVRIDMEDSPFIEDTLSLYGLMRLKGFENLGVVIQAYLYRSEADIRRILEAGGRVRLCKGAYQEPASVAFPQKSDVDDNYKRLSTQLMEGAIAAQAPVVSPDGRTPPIPAIASHDEACIRHAKSEIERLGLTKAAVEFQMLYGIRRDLQVQLAKAGYAVRVYVPYGSHWYPYFMRRLAERPANVWFFISNFFRK